LGASLVDDKSLNENTVFLCKTMQSIEKGINQDCDKYEKGVKKLNAGIDIMASYAKVLILVAENADFKTADKIEQSLKSLNGAKWIKANENEIGGLKGVADGLESLLINSAKRKAIGNTVNQINPSIQTACKEMAGIIKGQKELYNKLDLLLKNRIEDNQDFRKVVDSTGKVFTKEFVTYNDSDKILIGYSRKLIKDELDKLDESAKVFEAFGKGHQALVDNESFTLIGTKSDYKVVNSVIDSMKSIFDGIDKFKKPVTSN
jgi:hypothetical protein